MSDHNKLQETERKLRDLELALNESSIVAITDQRGRIQHANDQFCKISQYSREELIGSYHSMINSGYHPKSFFKNMWQTIGTGNVWRGEIKNQKKDGTYYWVDTTIVPFLKPNGKPYQYIAIRHDITALKEYEETIEKMAYSDPLTNLPNRNQMIKWIEENLNEQGNKIAAFFIDIDQFKTINEKYGHLTGDLILQEVAAKLRNNIRKTDFISRWGGDEFTIILNNNDSNEAIVQIAKRILNSTSSSFSYKQFQIPVSISIGISTGIYHNEINKMSFVETLIQQANKAMYRVKEIGGKSYHLNTYADSKNVPRTYQVEAEIKNALEKNEFHIAYQPIINLKNKQIVSLEALLRWNNENLGLVSPGEFIPILEQQLLIIPVGNWVLKTVAAQMSKWQEEGIFFERISVNVSPIQLKNPNFIQDLKNIFNATQMDPSYLELEVTESTLLEFHHSTVLFEELQALGIKISIDDFGTGYSSLSYLKKLPINTLKIDKSFIDDLDHHGKILVTTIMSMGKNLGYRVIAEGIETQEQLEFLKKQSLSEGQGYYFSKPVKSEEINQLMSNKNRK
jgi:diguanylate cyclase (GGDEF)-like protein/PAS domain S-box-containing protein